MHRRDPGTARNDRTARRDRRFTTEIGSGLAALPSRIAPAKSSVLVLTGGHESASREWAKDAVKQLISQQEDKYGWDFVFLGANIDAVDVGTDLGFSAGKSLTYDASSEGVGGAFASVSSYNSRKRSRGAKVCQRHHVRRCRSPTGPGTAIADATA